MTHLLLIFICFAALATSLHLKPRYNHLYYAETLKSNLDLIHNDLTTLNSSLTNTLNNKNNDQKSRINDLELAIISARKQMIDIYLKAGDSLNSSRWACQTINTQTKAELTNNLNGIKDAFNNIESVLQTTNGDANSIASIKQYTQHGQALSDQLMQGVYSIGIQSATPPIIQNQTNLLSPNWVLGSTSIDTLANNYQSNSTRYVQMCPPDQPYLDSNNQCVQCSLAFRLDTKTCSKCSNFDLVNHQCKDITVFNATNMPAATGSILLTGSDNPNILSNAITDGVCPSTTPFFTGSTCISCPLLFDWSKKICTSCNNSFVYNSTTKHCDAPTFLVNNVANLSGILLPPNTTLQQYQQSLVSNQNANLVSCPLTTPFFDGSKCLSCPSNQYFSVTIRGCQTCPPQQIYNQTTCHCQKIVYYSNINNGNWTSVGKTAQQIINNININSTLPNSQPCPIITPFFNGQNCIVCQEPNPLFSYDSLTCTSCLAKTFFSQTLQNCVTPSSQQTNPNSTNLIFDGRSKNEWMSIYYNKITSNAQISDCPTQKPYFDGLTCVICPQQQPYFNLQTLRCQNCDIGTTYNAQVSECISNSGNIVTQSPTLQKMAAGIFA